MGYIQANPDSDFTEPIEKLFMRQRRGRGHVGLFLSDKFPPIVGVAAQKRKARALWWMRWRCGSDRVLM
ncbi:hypothetical protein GWA01_03330 [Gluconobacter wancherniae NBRC 103581]|uniref:Uncharacterized protein n=1 Tax=Gluconobacter wancherniae NBRC 103581 TaxID=656744 RepID=A0A511AZ42_9PROT|nr:hypothetical protein AA103581_1121 [Gluconobacter wancherniae NBRC 103581]GEK92563.1 hypothetical protein GWA01_03330 [Gluconobacter wancherniae NBRC 103581]